MRETSVDILRNWKTTVAGIVVIGLTVMLILGKLRVMEYLSAVGFVLGGGLMLSKDGDKTGTASAPKQASAEKTKGQIE